MRKSVEGRRGGKAGELELVEKRTRYRTVIDRPVALQRKDGVSSPFCRKGRYNEFCSSSSIPLPRWEGLKRESVPCEGHSDPS